jgi:hypothetical protein
MKVYLMLALIILAPNIVLADMTRAQLQRDQYKAVLDALVSQHKIRNNDTILAVEAKTAGEGVAGFGVKIVNSLGVCQNKAATVYTRPQAKSEFPNYEVEFPPIAPTLCTP